MAAMLKAMRLLADPNRVRLLLLLERDELSVAELQEILAKGQSQISTHLSQLRQAGLVEDRRTGKNIFYRLAAARGNEAKLINQLLDLLRKASAEVPEAEQDREALKLVLRKRHDRLRTYFDGLAGRFGREYVPGRSWKGLAEALLILLPKITIADLGAGEGTFSQLLAQRAERVIAVDSSEKMVKFGAALARKHGVRNLEYRHGDMEDLPIDDSSVDLAFFSQSLHHAVHPQQAVAEAARILKPGGRTVILDLNRHHFEEARELYADTWLGFTELELRRFLRKSGFRKPHAAVVHREQEPPHFETLLVTGEKPA
ncbi:MAG TPA: metalloregulator ArsR/SmtB family transcription factor [Bryobacteraceae bacterium]|nr:metalloregulator ArsR/SmtB family transcription factor [Bryobacteraceae bacterium]